jgi:hypothetical protein
LHIDIAITRSTLFWVAELKVKPDVLRQDVASSEHMVETYGTICSNMQDL